MSINKTFGIQLSEIRVFVFPFTEKITKHDINMTSVLSLVFFFLIICVIPIEYVVLNLSNLFVSETQLSIRFSVSTFLIRKGY